MLKAIISHMPKESLKVELDKAVFQRGRGVEAIELHVGIIGPGQETSGPLSLSRNFAAGRLGSRAGRD